MRLHPLHTPEWLFDVMRSSGEYPDTSRATGRTEALALEYVCRAMCNPYQTIDVHDHHGTRAASVELMHRIRRIVDKLGYKHFYFRGLCMCFGCQPDRAE